MNNESIGILERFESKKRITKTDLLKIRERFDPKTKIPQKCPFCLTHGFECEECPIPIEGEQRQQCNLLLSAIVGREWLWQIDGWQENTEDRRKVVAYVDSLLERGIYINR